MHLDAAAISSGECQKRSAGLTKQLQEETARMCSTVFSHTVTLMAAFSSFDLIRPDCKLVDR
jgi:hypothetical protein